MTAPLTYPDIHSFRAASGWLDLNNFNEAEAELNKISEGAQLHPDVLEIRWRTNAHVLNWTACIAIAETTIRVAPGEVSGWIHRSFALHELKRTSEALEKILPAVELFPKDWTLIYNVACYQCQLGDLPAARLWLARAFTLGHLEESRARALEDPDLQPLWNEIPTIGPIHTEKRTNQEENEFND